jgi:CBS domain-containing protein
MNPWFASEFADEYQDWIEGHRGSPRAAWLDITVGQLERHPLLSLPPDTTIECAIALMNQHERGALLVVQDAQLIGIFTERDVLRRVLPRGLSLARTQLSEVMTERPDVLPEHATLAQALRTMARSRYRHLPVVDEQGRPLTIVSMRRIIQFVCEAFPQQILNAPPERRDSDVFALEGG